MRVESRSMKRVLVFLATAVLIPTVHAQNRMTYSVVSPQNGHVALGLAIRKLNVSGTFMQMPAHPDDETNALFALFTHGMGLRSIDVQNNRGEGGQNEIGPELFRDLGVLRTSELLSAHRIDGAEQYFTRAIDYGYSFDPEEVINKWGRDEITGDYVRLIRMLRPDVVVTMNIQGRGGDRAHEATTILAREAYRAAGDPNRYPEQVRQGLHAWQPEKLYFAAGFGVVPAGGRFGRGGRGSGQALPPITPESQTPGLKVTRVSTAAYDELLGRTYAEIGADAHSNHKCQGTGGLPALPGFGGGRGFGGGTPSYQLVDSTIPGQMQKDEAGLFDAIDTSLAGIVQFAGANPPESLRSAVAAIVDQAERAKRAFDEGNDAATAAQRRGDRRSDRSGSRRNPIAARPPRIDVSQRRRSLRDRLPARRQGARLLGCRSRGARPHVRRRRRRWTRGWRTRGEAVAACGQPRPNGCRGEPRRHRRPRGRVAVRPRRPEEGCGLHVQLGHPRAEEREVDDAVFFRRLLEGPVQAGDQHVRSRCALRRALRADAIPRDVPCESRRCRRDQRAADPIPVCEGHLQRRQAHGAERGAGVLGAGDAGAGRAAGLISGRHDARSARGGDQRHEGRRRCDGRARAAVRMESVARERLDRLRARRRS